jgi:hypothetical protein
MSKYHKCLYFGKNLLAKCQQTVERENLSLAGFVKMCILHYYETHPELDVKIEGDDLGG